MIWKAIANLSLHAVCVAIGLVLGVIVMGVKCRSHVEWCKVEQPRLHEALFGEVEE